MGLQERFLAKVLPEPNSGCWLWDGATTPAGYGKLSVNGKVAAAHRISYEMHIGPIPDGLEIDHLCCVKGCVNPNHLEAVTHSENCKRGPQGEHVARKMLAKTHCPQGHKYTPENTIQRGSSRSCKTCSYAGVRRWKAQNPDYQREWAARNPDRIAVYEKSRRQRRGGV